MAHTHQNNQLQPFQNISSTTNQVFPLRGPTQGPLSPTQFPQSPGGGGQQPFDFSQLASQFGLSTATGGASVPLQIGAQTGGVLFQALSELFSGPSIQEQAFEQVQQRVKDTPEIDPKQFQSQALASFIPEARRASQTAEQRFNIGNAEAFDEIFAQFAEQMQLVQQRADMQAQIANLQAFVQNSQLIASFA